VQFGLDALLSAQFPNGGFPQVWTGPVERHPVIKASFPNYDWRTENRIKEYRNLYTLNDNLAGDVAKTLILAHEVYGGDRYQVALSRLGDFLLLAQMPDPQPAWCQQYSFDMKPAWARKFEPPAIVSSESQDVMRALMLIYRATKQEKYLLPVPRALSYFKRSLLPDGRLPRYFELRTNKPLYMRREDNIYSLTYDDSKLPSHYAFKINSGLGKIRREYERLEHEGPLAPPPANRPGDGKVRTILDALDDRGRWITTYDGTRLSGHQMSNVDFASLVAASSPRTWRH